MIRINRGYVSESNGLPTLFAEIDINSDRKDVYISVDSEYGKFLSPERADWALIGMIAYATRNNHDIICEAPVTEELLYNIREILIPTLLNNDRRNHPIKIQAKLAPPLDKLPFAKTNCGGVGTGFSCGVDSFHALLKNLDSDYPSQNLTHLTFMNVGNFHPGYGNRIPVVKEKIFEHSQAVAAAVKLPIIKIESNFQRVITMPNGFYHTFRSIMVVYALQKLWRVYYYASGYSFKDFTLKGNWQNDPAYYDLLLLDLFSIANLRLISAGGEGDRNDKIDFIADNPLAQKYLHVCIRTGGNCGACEKCMRTLLSLDAAGKLDNFRDVFDIEKYLKMREDAYIFLHDRSNLPHSAPFYQKSYQILYKRHKDFFDAITPETKRNFKPR